MGLFLASMYASMLTGFKIGKNGSYITYDYTKLPNSCFIESLIYSSRASLALKSETTPKIYASIFGYTYNYNDDIKIYGKTTATVFGHAICIFEYKNKLWAYDMNYGTMYVGVAGNKNKYDARLKNWAEDTYGIKIIKCFVVDDWEFLPADIDRY